MKNVICVLYVVVKNNFLVINILLLKTKLYKIYIFLILQNIDKRIM